MARELKNIVDVDVRHSFDEASVGIIRLAATLAGHSSSDDTELDPLPVAITMIRTADSMLVQARKQLGLRAMPIRLLRGGQHQMTDEEFATEAKADTERKLHGERLDELAILEAFRDVSDNRFRQTDLLSLVDSSGLGTEEAHAAINRLAVQNVVCLFNDMTEEEIESPGCSGRALGIRAPGGKWFHSAKLTSPGLVIAKGVWLSLDRRGEVDDEEFPI